MFPLQRNNELVIEFSNGSSSLHQISQDPILLEPEDHDLVVDDFNSDKKLAGGANSHSRPKKIMNGVGHDPNNSNQADECKKKIVHREIERQRRQEMATLQASLRSLLPLHFIKGKRSLSDQMNEAVNYINYLQKNIKELSAKRDELKKHYYSSVHERNKCASSSSFSVHQNNNDGLVGIEITSGFTEEEEEGCLFPLSKLMELLLEEGLDVVTCVSTQVNGRLLHSLHCQVNNSDSSVDLSELRRKLSNVIPSFRCCD